MNKIILKNQQKKREKGKF